MAQLKNKNLNRVRNYARNTASAAEFIIETVRAESRFFANLAVAKVTTRLSGENYKPQRDASLEPLAGVPVHSSGVMDDPLSRWS